MYRLLTEQSQFTVGEGNNLSAINKYVCGGDIVLSRPKRDELTA